MGSPALLPNAQLTANETDSIRKALGGTASPLCFGICRILISTSLSQGWQETDEWGAACLVMDRARNTKILRVFNMQTFEIVFDEELYIGMQYIAMRKYLHVFEAQGAVVAFDFTNDDDALNFHSRVTSMIPAASQLPSPSAGPSSSGGLLDKVKGIFSKKDKEMQIGSPSNVVHKHHIGIDPEKGFEIKNIPDEWKALFKASGVRPSDLKDFNTANLLFNTISSHYRSATQGPQRPAVNPESTFADPNIRPPPARALGAPPPPPHLQPGFNPAPSLPQTPVTTDPCPPVRRTRRAPVRGPPRQPRGPPPDLTPRAAPPLPPRRAPPLSVQVEHDQQQEAFDEEPVYNEHQYDASAESYGGVALPPPPPPPPPPAATLHAPSAPLSVEVPSTPSFRTSAATPNSRADLLSQIQAGKALRPVSSPMNASDDKSMNQALPDLSSMRDSDKRDMISHIKTLLDARRDHIEHNDDSDDDDAWD